MSDPRYPQLAQILLELSEHMQSYDLWATEIPSTEELKSDKPFCVDTLSFEKWVQFVMLPTFFGMIEHGMPLPDQCDISPMAQEIWKKEYIEVQACIRKIDELITGIKG